MSESMIPESNASVSASNDVVGGDFSPQWGNAAPKGGKAVVNRALKDGARVPLFLGQTLINSLRDLGYNNTTSALCEHIDNALQWGATEIRVYFRQTGIQPNQRIDALVYDNGQGMAPHVLKVAMAFGGSMVYDNRAGIGRYGMGMKAAGLNLARSFDVFSWQEPGAFYSMTLDVDRIGQDRNNMIELPDAELSDSLPTDVTEMFTMPMSYPKKADDSQDLFCEDEDALNETLGRSGTIVYLPNCDRLTFSTARGLVDHAVKELGRIYRRFIEKGARLFVNNRQVESFDPTYWMPSARHSKVEGLVETRSSLVDSWSVDVPVTEGSKKTTQIRVRMFLLPVEAWAILPRETLKNKLHVYDDNTVAYVRNDREVQIGSEPRLKLRKHATNNWFRIEIDFNGEADAGFGVAANKQGVRLQEYIAKLILERLQSLITQVRKTVREKQLKISAEEQIGQPSDAERLASDVDSIQSVALPAPPADTPEQIAALEANLRGLAVSLRQEGETEDQAFERVKASKYLTDFVHQEYAPFYDTEYKFGKLILRVNTAHPFYQNVWQPLRDLAKKTIQTDGEDVEVAGEEIAEGTRKALMGLRLLLLSLAQAQTQMLVGTQGGEHAQLFRNLRKAWSDVLETQFLHI